MVHFAPLDYFWTVSYLVLMIGCGAIFYKLGKRSGSDFFLAGRGLPWWLPATSNFATHTATDTPMWFSGLVYSKGLYGMWFSLFAGGNGRIFINQDPYHHFHVLYHQSQVKSDLDSL